MRDGNISAGAADRQVEWLREIVITNPWLSEYAFIISTVADAEALLDAQFTAGETGVELQTALFAAGAITPERYTIALGTALGAPVASYDIRFEAEIASRALWQPSSIKFPMPGYWRNVPVTVICATRLHPAVVRSQVLEARRSSPVVLVAEHFLRLAIEHGAARINLRRATTGLKRRLPLFSAGRLGPQWQPILLAVVIGLVLGSAIGLPRLTLAGISVLLTIPFFGVVFIRVIAMTGLFRRVEKDAHVPLFRTPDRDLPVYSILVALYDEPRILPQLVAALERMDYPATKLDCMLVIEDVDSATKAALLKLTLPPFMRVVVVPDGKPRTKPRALNYALSLARGEYVVIYDAEDRPEPDQLRRALTAFDAHKRHDGPPQPELACVQACLNIFNARQSWLTRGIMAQTPQGKTAIRHHLYGRV